MSAGPDVGSLCEGTKCLLMCSLNVYLEGPSQTWELVYHAVMGVTRTL